MVEMLVAPLSFLSDLLGMSTLLGKEAEPRWALQGCCCCWQVQPHRRNADGKGGRQGGGKGEEPGLARALALLPYPAMSHLLTALIWKRMRFCGGWAADPFLVAAAGRVFLLVPWKARARLPLGMGQLIVPPRVS